MRIYVNVSAITDGDGSLEKPFRRINEAAKIANIISSDTLGKAFEPEQRYENPDGSSIIFDVDYYGNVRKQEIVPGSISLYSCSTS